MIISVYDYELRLEASSLGASAFEQFTYEHIVCSRRLNVCVSKAFVRSKTFRANVEPSFRFSRVETLRK